MIKEYRDDGGDGLPGCPMCGGRGAIDVPEEQSKGLSILKVTPCQCVYTHRLLLNLHRGWKPALLAPKIASSPLLDKVEASVWVTATPLTMQAHLKHVALRQNPDWGFFVTSDSDLVVSWLGNMVLKRADIYDQEVADRVASRSLEHHSLADLVVPPELLIIQLGVKSAKNSETPSVLEEAIRSRFSEGKPTWVFDQPERPFTITHKAFSMEVEEFMEVNFHRVVLPSLGKSAQLREQRVSAPALTPSVSGAVSLSDLSGAPAAGRQTKVLRRPRTEYKKGGKK